MPCVVQIQWKPHAAVERRDGRFTLVEVDLEDFQAVCVAVQCDDLLEGLRLVTGPTGTRGERRVLERWVFAFRGGAVDRIELPTWKFVEDAS